MKKNNKDFFTRFDIETNIKTVRQKFINRSINLIFEDYFNKRLRDYHGPEIRRAIAFALGEKYNYRLEIEDYVKNDFLRCLQALEAFYNSIDNSYDLEQINKNINFLINSSELDLGILWRNGHFMKKGAKELDDALVNVPLKWISDKKYKNVLGPYSKGLELFLRSQFNISYLNDIITDMYESLEALSKIITKRPNKDLAANVDLFIKYTKTSNEYKKILKQYIAYAQHFRHGSAEDVDKPKLSVAECESFIYLTGVFIRLAIESQT